MLDEQGVSRFELLQRFQRDRKGALIYYVFDLLYLNGADLTDVPLERRREQGIEFFRAARQQK